MQKVIASRDVEILLTFDAIQVPISVQTGSTLGINITGNTEDIGAIGTDEPIATDNGQTSYDLTLSLQEAEAQRIMDALAAATVGSATGSVAHIRQIVESLAISVVWHRRRDVPATSTIETYVKCTGQEESDSVERRSAETLKTWRFRAQGKSRVTTPLG